ncbi:MAG TPA: hypothetical protein VK982_08270, partial [Bacteroidales bacterium]|nr:hypothetical protein [Bacteroidales bacterium]
MSKIDIKYKRQSDEDYDDYWWRICSNKDLNIYDLTWDEVGEILNEELNEDYSSSKWRKNYQVMKKGFDKAKKQSIEADELLEEIELKKLELKEERTKLSTLRLDLNKTVRNTSRFEQWIDEVKQAIKTVKIDIPEYKGINFNDYRKDYLLTIADIHTGKKGESLNNYYDLDVLQNRMWQIRNEVIELVKEKKIKTLKILSLGDLIDGLLRASQIQNLQILRAKQTVFIARFLFEWLNSISEYCYIDFKMTTSANHSESRPLDSKRGEFSSDDYEIIIYEWLSDLCKRNPRIKIEGNNIVEFDILGRQVIAMHGHQLSKIKNKKNMLANVSFHMNKQYQYMFIAHLHHTEIKTVGKNKLGNQEIIYCPCICGNDEYSDSFWTGAGAGSLFIEFNDK